ncbi:transcriptional regulator [Blastochloris viridis]|uniref:Transcriptional regulator n=1 Tax=Blastochloris viridis TaxID=1079 RepID=A0A182D431_BLAVI|nr:transcriptional regulator [Blastochloris viridis]
MHAAVRDLLAEVGRAELTIPVIAERAGVTPSTIYRRWGDLQELLGDVAVERLRPDAEPADTGTLRGDLDAWLEQYAEEMSSEPGQAMIRDVLACNLDPTKSCRCRDYLRDQLAVIAARAATRSEVAPDVDVLIDRIVAPVLYRILFDIEPPTPVYCRRLVAAALEAR